MGEISSSSFEFYEGLRTLVPGGLAVGLYAAIVQTFGLGGDVTVGHGLAALLAALAVGFVLLFLDIPSRAAVFQYQTPERFLRSWKDLAPRDETSHLNIYYEIVDVEMPAGIKTKIYYLGAIYRIGFEGIYVAAAAIPVLVVAVVFPSVGVARGETSSTAIRWLFVAALLSHTLVVSIALWSRYDQHRRKEKSSQRGTRIHRWSAVGNDLRREIPILDRFVLAVGLGALALNLVFGWRWAGVAGVALPGATWAVRYYRGVSASAGGPRQNLHAVTATLTYGLAALSICAIGARWAPSKSPLDAGVVVGWALASLVGGALISARAHERKLLGSYSTQRTWLAGKRDVLVKEGYFVQTGSSS
jgi:hypothetical protein